MVSQMDNELKDKAQEIIDEIYDKGFNDAIECLSNIVRLAYDYNQRWSDVFKDEIFFDVMTSYSKDDFISKADNVRVIIDYYRDKEYWSDNNRAEKKGEHAYIIGDEVIDTMTGERGIVLKDREYTFNLLRTDGSVLCVDKSKWSWSGRHVNLDIILEGIRKEQVCLS